MNQIISFSPITSSCHNYLQKCYSSLQTPINALKALQIKDFQDVLHFQPVSKNLKLCNLNFVLWHYSTGLTLASSSILQLSSEFKTLVFQALTFIFDKVIFHILDPTFMWVAFPFFRKHFINKNHGTEVTFENLT